MDKSAIKNFAVSARIKLKESIQQKAYELGITNSEIKDPESFQNGYRVNQKFLTEYQMKQREKLINKIYNQGLENIIEEVAYTWFNRLIALRFMEINEYLPIGIRVLSSNDKDKIEPDAVTNVLAIADDLELDLDIIFRLQDENNSEELFQYILVKQCNKLGELMPVMFEQIEDYTELLLPNHLLADGSVIRDLVTMIREEDWLEQTEIIGWLYQHYISEKKEEIDRKKGKVSKEDLPAKTQLFTPKWIVKYMLDNSIGKIGIECFGKELQKECSYYIETRQDELGNGDKNQLNRSPEEIKVIDPSMGSGHVLVYAFDILYKLYQNAGYSERKIPQLILEKNLYGLDIDDRAAQLAYFSLLMKARSFDRRILQKKIEMNIMSIQESNEFLKEAVDFLDEDKILYLYNEFTQAKEIGSLLYIGKIDIDYIEKKIEELRTIQTEDLFSEQYYMVLVEWLPLLLKQAKILSTKYDVVCTNPPYLGSGKISPILSKYLGTYYPDSKRDLYTAFIEKCLFLTKDHAYTAMITQEPWMFAAAFDKFRLKILQHAKIINLLHLGTKTFEEISGEVVKSAAFVLKNEKLDEMEHFPLFVDLTSYDTKRKEKEIFNNDHWYQSLPQKLFASIPKYPICYWATKNTLEIFNEENTIPFKAGRSLQTGNDPLFIRYWYEVDINKTTLKSMNDEAKWFLFNKGGPYRKWYGNNGHILLWENNGELIKQMHQKGEIKATLRNLNFFFKKGITYTYITSGDFSARYSSEKYTYSGAGPAVISEDPYYLLAFLNSKVFNYLVRLFKGETERYESGDVEAIPLLKLENREVYNEIIDLVHSAITISAEGWNDREQSFEFKKHPLLYRKSSLLQKSIQETLICQKSRKNKLKEIEERINKIFIQRYRMEDVLDDEVAENKISILMDDEVTLLKSFISYFVGCLLGRFSLDREGICFAGGSFDPYQYQEFTADKDNIIPITEDEYFDDDIVSRFIDFVRHIYGKETLEENLDYISKILTKRPDETSRQRIRRYFLREFYQDHLQMYQRCPIYWLFNSGKNNGFKALIYVHRYDVDTIAKLRTEYLHKLQRKYESEITRLEQFLESGITDQDKINVKKQKETLQLQLNECRQFDQLIAHAANKKIELDLDDGIKKNYEKLQNMEVEQINSKRPTKTNILEDF